MSASSKKQGDYKINSAKQEANSFTLTLSEATTALSSTGKWDSKQLSEDPKKKCKGLNAVPIKTLKISNLPSTIVNKTNKLHWNPVHTPIYTFIQLLKLSKVEVLDLSNYQFDTESLLTIAYALNQGVFSLKTIKLDKNQPALQELKNHLEETSLATHIKFEYVEPAQQLLSKPSA